MSTNYQAWAWLTEGEIQSCSLYILKLLHPNVGVDHLLPVLSVVEEELITLVDLLHTLQYQPLHARNFLGNQVEIFLRMIDEPSWMLCLSGSIHAHLLLTFQHRAGVRPYTSSYDFAEPCVFSKQSPPPGLCPQPILA